jgi:hypothetical protein
VLDVTGKLRQLLGQVWLDWLTLKSGVCLHQINLHEQIHELLAAIKPLVH